MMITSKKNRHQSLLVLLTLLTTLLISCGKQEDGPVGSIELFDSQIIVGDVDWKEITSLRSTTKIRKASSSVADIKLPVMRSRCTGFLISEDILMTNEHCIPTAAHAEGVTASFRHLKGVSEENWESYDCSTFVMNNSELDFALLKCSGAPGRKFGFTKLDSTRKSSGTSIYVVQQNCDYYSERGCDWTKKYSKGSITEVEDEYTHNADTLGGSSGSPVFDYSTHKVVGLHHAGYGNNGMGRGYENYAVPMSNIVPAIKAKFPNIFDSAPTSPTPGSGNTNADRTEPNNSVSNAFKLSGKTQTVSGLEISDAKDMDYFSIKAKAGAKVEVSAKFKHSRGDLDLYTVSSSGAILTKVESSNDDEVFSVKSNGSTIYFVVFGYKSAENKYDLKVSVSAAPAAPTSNNTMSSATYLRGDQDFSDSLESKEDVDFFKFYVASTKTVKASIEFTHKLGDLDFKLIDMNGKVVKSSAGTKDIESITTKLAKGSYYLKVFGYKGSVNSYQLKLNK